LGLLTRSATPKATVEHRGFFLLQSLRRLLIPTILVIVLAGCRSIPSPDKRIADADHLADQRGWNASVIAAGRFSLVAYLPRTITPSPSLTVYIEGDGLAWLGGSHPSQDPTPVVPLALRLALAQPTGSAAYLARPCQYAGRRDPICIEYYWTEGRFSREVVESTSIAIDALMRRFSASRLTLVGYSGGGAIAALVAANRSDVERLITVAGNLDHLAWTRHHGLPSLAGSLNPADQVDQLQSIPQWHFVGARDRVIPPAIAQGFADRFPGGHQPRVIVEADFDHQCCWAENWPGLFSEAAKP
jgi:pimeloyl-ACP methyl ester carboxylesterase